MSESEEKIIYPKLLDEYFKNNQVTLKTIPDKYRIVKQDALPNKTIKSTRILVNYIEKEIAFWNYENVDKNFIVSNYTRLYNQAKTNIQQAIDFSDSNPQQAISYLKNAITVIQNCQINSSTELAKMFKHFNQKDSYFFHGFDNALNSTNQSVSYYNYSSWHEGFYFGMEYKQAISSIEKYVQQYNMTYSEAVKEAEKEIANLLEKTTTLFHDQELRVKDLWENNKVELEKQKEELTNYVNQKQIIMTDLEKTYEEKLRLSKPADYWLKMSKSYRKGGYGWLITSAILAIAIITMLTIMIIKVPTLFTNNVYWLDIVKNTALLTVITGVAIYILRITVKLSMSSFHLSRDAKEREQLTYFYLSLMKNAAITEKERALIINSLFSRSDTGLLKGDSAPSMTSNISDLLDKDKSK